MDSENDAVVTSDSPNEQRNLPAIVTRVGGALEKVMRDVHLYEDDANPLSRVHIIALSRIVEARPSLNTEKCVDVLVNLFSRHGVPDAQRRDVTALVDQFGAMDVGLAFEYLYDAGYRGAGRTAAGDDPGLRNLKAVLRIIREMRQDGEDEISSESIHVSGRRLGDYTNDADFDD